MLTVKILVYENKSEQNQSVHFLFCFYSTDLTSISPPQKKTLLKIAKAQDWNSTSGPWVT